MGKSHWKVSRNSYPNWAVWQRRRGWGSKMTSLKDPSRWTQSSPPSKTRRSPSNSEDVRSRLFAINVWPLQVWNLHEVQSWCFAFLVDLAIFCNKSQSFLFFPKTLSRVCILLWEHLGFRLSDAISAEWVIVAWCKIWIILTQIFYEENFLLTQFYPSETFVKSFSYNWIII